MSSLRLVKQLENSAAKFAVTPDFCEHGFAEIVFPDNRTQKFPPCFRCSKPRLVAILNFEDGRVTPRIIESARRAFTLSAEKFPEISEAERRAAVAGAYHIDEKLL